MGFSLELKPDSIAPEERAAVLKAGTATHRTTFLVLLGLAALFGGFVFVNADLSTNESLVGLMILVVLFLGPATVMFVVGRNRVRALLENAVGAMGQCESVRLVRIRNSEMTHLTLTFLSPAGRTRTAHVLVAGHPEKVGAEKGDEMTIFVSPDGKSKDALMKTPDGKWVMGKVK